MLCAMNTKISLIKTWGSKEITFIQSILCPLILLKLAG